MCFISSPQGAFYWNADSWSSVTGHKGAGSAKKYRFCKKISLRPRTGVFAHQDERCPLIGMGIRFPYPEHRVSHGCRLIFAFLKTTIESGHEIRFALVMKIP